MLKTDHITLNGREIATGEQVVVRPSSPGRRDGFAGKFISAQVTEHGTPVSVTVFGSTGRKAPAMRTFTIERIAPAPLPRVRRSQPH